MVAERKRPTILELDSGRIRPIAVQNSQKFPDSLSTAGFSIEQLDPDELSFTNISLTANTVCLNMDGDIEMEWIKGDQRVCKTIRPGQITIMTANDPYSIKVRSSGRRLFISIDEKILACAAMDQGYSGEMQPEWTLGADDPFVRELMLEILRETSEVADTNMGYVEAMIHTLAVHIIRRYSQDQLSRPPAANGLNPSALRKVVHFIHDNLHGELSIARLADQANLSTAHFARMFKNSTGMSPHQYILLCRINRAKQLLMNRQMSLAEISASTGFCDQSHFTRSFQKIVKTTPSSYARSFRITRG